MSLWDACWARRATRASSSRYKAHPYHTTPHYPFHINNQPKPTSHRPQVPFAYFFLNTLLGRANSFDELPSLDATLTKNLLSVKHYDGAISMWCECVV